LISGTSPRIKPEFGDFVEWVEVSSREPGEFPGRVDGWAGIGDNLDHFATQVFAEFRMRELADSLMNDSRIRQSAQTAALQKFQKLHKLLLMAHSPANYPVLGRFAANSEEKDFSSVLAEYRELFSRTMATPATREKRVNVLQHALGYMKESLDSAKKSELNEALESYRLEKTPFLPLLFRIYDLAADASISYLKEQLFFAPYPKELMLRFSR
jgi:uncharacterized protein YbgA (DUF1722 family)